MYIATLLGRLWESFQAFSDNWAQIILVAATIVYLFLGPSVYSQFNAKKLAVKEGAQKWWMQLPFRLTLVILALSVFVFIDQYGMYRDLQRTSSEQQSQLSKALVESKQQLADLQAKTLIPLGVSPPVVSNRTEPSPVKAEVTITARGTPPYSSRVTRNIVNYNQKLFIYEVLKFKTSEGFKFAPMKDDVKVPAWFTITPGYEDTETMIVIVANYPPLASNPISFEVYTFDLNKKYTENVTEEIVTTGIERSLE